jgi:hypothetical protein
MLINCGLNTGSKLALAIASQKGLIFIAHLSLDCFDLSSLLLVNFAAQTRSHAGAVCGHDLKSMVHEVSGFRFQGSTC